MGKSVPDIKNRLIFAALVELQEHGISDFSIRRVAADCGVSCAAPYKYFDGKNALIDAVIDFVSDEWKKTVCALLDGHTGTTREKLLDISIAYIRFLYENPGYYTVVIMNEKFLSRDRMRNKSLISPETGQVIREYCESVGMDKETEKRKTFIVRALIIGAAEMMTADSLHYTDENLNMVRSCINREFDIV